MEEKSAQLKALEVKLAPPEHSTASIVLNGISNGAMVVGFPLFLFNVVHKTTGKGPAAFAHSRKAAIFTAVTGCSVGAWFGLAEAKRTQEYRNSVAEEIVKLRADLENPKSWANKVEQQAESGPETLGVGA